MIKQLKFSLKMLKYGHGVIMNILSGVVCALLGLLLLIGSAITPGTAFISSNAQTLSGFLLSMTGVFLVQVWMSLCSSGLILSSPHCRASLCAIPVLLESLCILAGFTLVLAIRLILRGFFPSAWLEISRDLYLLAATIFLVILFFAFAYRYYVISFILFIIGYFTFYTFGFVLMHYLQITAPDSVFFTMPVTLVICYGIIFSGIALNWLFTYLLRKKPLDKWAQGAMLRKYL